MVRHNSTLYLYWGIFVAAISAVVVIEYFFGLTAGDRSFYFVHHYFFGVGGPFFFAPFYSTEGSVFRVRKQFPNVSMFMWRHVFSKLAGKGFWVGIAICSMWSIENEILVYWVLNPAHGADWGHWAADGAGMLTAYLIYLQLLAREATIKPIGFTVEN